MERRGGEKRRREDKCSAHEYDWILSFSSNETKRTDNKDIWDGAKIKELVSRGGYAKTHAYANANTQHGEESAREEQANANTQHGEESAREEQANANTQHGEESAREEQANANTQHGEESAREEQANANTQHGEESARESEQANAVCMCVCVCVRVCVCVSVKLFCEALWVIKTRKDLSKHRGFVLLPLNSIYGKCSHKDKRTCVCVGCSLHKTNVFNI